MIFKEVGKKDLPTIILLHGGGLSDWSLQGLTQKLKDSYHIVTPIIDGHGEDGSNLFISIEDSAQKIIEYIDKNYGGQVYALCGLSIGAQLVTEILSIRQNITQYAVIESALVYPIRSTAAFTVPTLNLLYGMIKKRWFSKLQAKSLYVPQTMFENYYIDSSKMSKQSLINIVISNGNYKLKNQIANTKAKVLIIAGEKELGIMKKSARRLNEVIVTSKLYIAPKMRHGEISLRYPEKYVETIINFFSY